MQDISGTLFFVRGGEAMVLLVFYKYGFFVEFGDLLLINLSSSHSDLTSIEVLLTIRVQISATPRAVL